MAECITQSWKTTMYTEGKLVVNFVTVLTTFVSNPTVFMT